MALKILLKNMNHVPKNQNTFQFSSEKHIAKYGKYTVIELFPMFEGLELFRIIHLSLKSNTNKSMVFILFFIYFTEGTQQTMWP